MLERWTNGSWARRLAALATATMLAACSQGGGFVSYKDGGGTTEPPTEKPATKAEASRFLGQSTFGPRDQDIDQLISAGYSNWINNQFAQPYATLLGWFDGQQLIEEGRSPSQNWLYSGFWRNTAVGTDQLRQRVTYALSQIFVISLRDGSVSGNPRGAADYYDTLTRHAFGNFRNLLQDVTLHPMMGLYLSHMGNQKANPESGRVPDENYARELMQLFTIGLYELNPDGTNRLDGAGQPIETYSNADVEGLARVFTGLSWGGPDTQDGRFKGWIKAEHREIMPMQGYPKYHESGEKRFLGLTIAPQAGADPIASVNAALDHLFAHPNVGPFIGKQLIQRLVTSNPSPAYVARVAAQFDDNGEGVRGDMRALVKAILFDPEARDLAVANMPGFGKLREPVLRFAHWMRSFYGKSDSGRFLIGNTEDDSNSLGQSVLRSPSVFNYYRPGYVPPNTEIATQGLVAPEMQITHETSVAGWLNVMRDVVSSGYGSSRDVKSVYPLELALAERPAELVERINLILMHGAMSNTLRTRVLEVVQSVQIPFNNPANADKARKARVHLAVFLTFASSEYAVLK
ncbi:MAG: DUF1800 domain-containing protein [Burkholderiaceae bacterium]